MRNIIINLLNSDRWKIQWTIASNFISLKKIEEEHEMHSMSNNIKFVDEHFEQLCSKHQGNLETSMRGSDFIFDSV